MIAGPCVALRVPDFAEPPIDATQLTARRETFLYGQSTLRGRALVQSIQARYSSACTIYQGDWKERHTMGQVSGDKAKYNRERRKKIARRAEMRALRARLSATGTATPKPKAGAATKS